MNKKINLYPLLLILITIILIVLFGYIVPKPKLPTEGIPHNYYYPDEDVMWITSEGDTIWE